jgi:hypothetical protein
MPNRYTYNKEIPLLWRGQIYGVNLGEENTVIYPYKNQIK